MKALLLTPLLALAACTNQHLDVCKYSVQSRQVLTASLTVTVALMDDARAKNKLISKAVQDAYDTTSTALIALNAACPVDPHF
jgi:hypothetical protein